MSNIISIDLAFMPKMEKGVSGSISLWVMEEQFQQLAMQWEFLLMVFSEESAESYTRRYSLV